VPKSLQKGQKVKIFIQVCVWFLMKGLKTKEKFLKVIKRSSINMFSNYYLRCIEKNLNYFNEKLNTCLKILRRTVCISLNNSYKLLIASQFLV